MVIIMRKSMYIGYDLSKRSEHRAKAIKESGFSHTVLWWGTEGKNRFEQVKICERLDLAIENAHTAFDNINSMWLEGEEGEGITEYLINSVAEARDCGIPVLVVHLSSSFTPPPVGTLGLSRYSRICEEADKKGVIIAFENLRRVDYLDYIMENIAATSKAFCFDCGHEFLYNEGIGVLEKYASRLTAVHIHDNFGKVDDHMLPFEGRIDWAALTRRLARLERNFTISLEVMREDSEPDFTDRAFECACRLEKMIEAAREEMP